jgi:ABC-type polysaccharide/polyol phosphate transport system ATPase subunit
LTTPDGTIRAERVWKRFRPDVKKNQFRDSVHRGLTRVRGGAPDWSWAVRDVTVMTEPGDSTGIVGNNGSGKSTFLKILAGVMDPYAGRVKVAGRIGALIEVRGGIHPELTGRENIYLYGTLLGLRRSDIVRQFDEIVAFGELEDAVDRQVKFYSSGMGMRLGFSVAAFLEPDVLLVDEVLAVGDASFQQRCLAKMRDVLSNGTSLVFVSHDLASVEAICTRGIWMQEGVVQADAPVAETLSYYRQAIEEVAAAESSGDGRIRLRHASVSSDADDCARTLQPLDIALTFDADSRYDGDVVLGISEGTANPMLVSGEHVEFRGGLNTVRCRIDRLPLPGGRFFVWVAVYVDGQPLLRWHPATPVDVVGPDLPRLPPGIMRQGRFVVDTLWDRDADAPGPVVGAERAATPAAD